MISPQARTALRALLIGGALLLVACGGDEGTRPSANPQPENNGTNNSTNNGGQDAQVHQLSPTDHLVRASMALRGRRPSLEDLEAVEADPDALEGVVDGYLREDAFGEVVREMHNEVLLVRPLFFSMPPRGEYEAMTMVDFNKSASESPLRLVEHVVMNDRPYSEIVTADYTVADEVVSYIWGLDYDGDGAQWVETRWPEEGRVHAGLLTDSRLWIRHYSTPLNAQRSRANLVTKAFLCFDFLDNDINVDGNIDLTDPEALKSSVKSPECATCHQDLDPLAALFWKNEFFVFPSSIQGYPYSHYKPEYEQYRTYFSDSPKAYFGQPVEDMAGLGQALAADPKFSACAVRRFYSWLHQIPMEEVPPVELSRLQRSFEDNNMNARALAREIVLADSFRYSHSTLEGADGESARLQKVRPRQWTGMMEDLIGYRWEVYFRYPLDFLGSRSPYGDIDLMGDNLLGYEVIAGGIDDFLVTHPVHTISPTSSLVFDNFAREAAAFVVDRDLGGDAPDAGRLLTIDPEETGEQEVRQQLAQLHRRLLAEMVQPQEDSVDESYALFRDALALSGDTHRAWSVVLTAMLQDSRLIYY